MLRSITRVISVLIGILSAGSFIMAFSLNLFLGVTLERVVLIMISIVLMALTIKED